MHGLQFACFTAARQFFTHDRQVFKSDTTVYIADDGLGINKLTTTNSAALSGPWVSSYVSLVPTTGGKGARYLTGRFEGTSFVLYCVIPPAGAALLDSLYRYNTSTEGGGGR